MGYPKNPSLNSLNKKEAAKYNSASIFINKEPRVKTRGSFNVSYNRSESQ